MIKFAIRIFVFFFFVVPSSSEHTRFFSVDLFY